VKNVHPRIERFYVLKAMKYVWENPGKDPELERILRNFLTGMDKLKHKYRLIQAKEQKRLKVVK